MDFIANIASLEDLFNQLPVDQRLTPMLKLRGAVAYRAAKLAGMVMAKRAKIMRDEHGMPFTAAMESALSDIDMFNQEQAAMTQQEFDLWAIDQMGLEARDMLVQLRTMVCYANKLNFDMLDIVDPSGQKRLAPGFKQQGVYHDDHTQRESWLSTIALHAEEKDSLDCATYAEYVAKMEGNGAFTLSEDEWNELMSAENLYAQFDEQIADCVLMFGDDEAHFTDLPERTQITLIEGMRGKLEDIASKLVKSVKYQRIQPAQKVAEAAKLKGIVLSWDKLLCEMLDLPRFRPYAEFMYSYVPGARDVNPATIKTRRVIQKSAPVGRVDDVTAQRINGVDEKDIERGLVDADAEDAALRVANFAA